MCRQLVGREDVLAVWFGVARVAVGFVEGIDHQRPFHLDRLVLLGLEEHQASAETANRRLIRLIQHGVRPDGYNLLWFTRLLLAQGPGHRLAQVQRRAAGGRRQAQREQQKLSNH
jgi:hypothetical protein